ncbi:MAG: FAD binding domain-containing protein, partial [Pseudomonadota bacterium]|nr:FAD binding domain-containing protein [Pseudomonadota bacterium]
ALRAANPDATLLAGGTDIGLWLTKQLRTLGDVIYLGHVAELAAVAFGRDTVEIGAAVTLEQAYNAMGRIYPAELAVLQHRFACLPIRSAGTLGGNLANGSPIGDSMPWLIVLRAQIVVQSLRGKRVMPLEDFYLGYRQQALLGDEVVVAVRVPTPRAAPVWRTYKVARRFDQDISAICAAFAIVLENGVVRSARIAFGGMAATPQRAQATEQALLHQPWNATSVRQAMATLTQDYAPLSDLRASASYRMRVAQNLLWRFWLELSGGDAALDRQVDVFAHLGAVST